jgi:hypothetical protein
MKKAMNFLGIAALCLAVFGAFGLVLAGCPAGNDGPTAEELADQLTEEINELKEGIATVNGATVTLNSNGTDQQFGGHLVLRSDLTVPADVTLDVTADGAAILLRDTTLTVNGTVIAAPSAIRLEDSAYEGTINGSGAINLKGKGSLLNVSGNRNGVRTLTLDGVTLVGVADNSNPLVRVSNGGEFVMKSGAITGNTNIGENAHGGGVLVNEGGVFTMEGGAVSGNTTDGGNENSGTGGGVRVENGGVFTLKDGTISGNTAKSVNGFAGGGGVTANGIFTMEGGTISGNTADQTNSDGGGVRVNNGVFTLKGGTIYGNSDNLPAGVDASLANSAKTNASLTVSGTAKWGMGGVYTEGGEPRTGDSDIVPNGGTDKTLIAKQN